MGGCGPCLGCVFSPQLILFPNRITNMGQSCLIKVLLIPQTDQVNNACIQTERRGLRLE